MFALAGLSLITKRGLGICWEGWGFGGGGSKVVVFLNFSEAVSTVLKLSLKLYLATRRLSSVWVFIFGSTSRVV